jgi:hypothetical protein
MNAIRLAMAVVHNSYRRHPAAPALAIAISMAALVAACANPLAHSGAAKPVVPRCADLVAHAIASPQVAVPGSYECFNSTMAAQLAAYGTTTDQDIAIAAAQPPVYTSYHYVGHTAAGWYFQMGGQGVTGCYRLHVDSNGLVDHGAFAPTKCPYPLP